LGILSRADPQQTYAPRLLREARDLLARSFRAASRKRGTRRVGPRKRLRRIARE
jgi:hypothetical protein